MHFRSLLTTVLPLILPTIAYGVCVPQPGAVPGPYISNSAPAETVTEPGWPDLPDKAAVNFKDGTIKPTQILPPPLPPLPLYRVWGGAAGVGGRYWTDQQTTSRREFYGNSAVQYSWNSGTYQSNIDKYLWTTTNTVEPIKVWSGIVARQPAQNTCGKVISRYYLPGGGNQTFIPNAIPNITTSLTPWRAKPPRRTMAAMEAVEFPPLTGRVSMAHCAALADRVRQLAGQLLAMDAGDNPATPQIIRQGGLLLQQAKALTPGAQAAVEGSSIARCKLIAASLLPLDRYLDGTADWIEARNGPVLADVIQWSAAIVRAPE